MDDMTTGQAARALGVDVSTIRRWALAGVLKHETVNKRMRFKRADVEAMRVQK
jgi:excisionase family DNA binding protein